MRRKTKRKIAGILFELKSTALSLCLSYHSDNLPVLYPPLGISKSNSDNKFSLSRVKHVTICSIAAIIFMLKFSSSSAR